MKKIFTEQRYIQYSNAALAALRAAILYAACTKFTGNMQYILGFTSVFGLSMNIHRMTCGYSRGELTPIFMTICVIHTKDAIDFLKIMVFSDAFIGNIFRLCNVYGHTVCVISCAAYLNSKNAPSYAITTSIVIAIVATSVAGYMISDFVFEEMAKHDLGLGKCEFAFRCLVTYSCCAALYDTTEDARLR